MLGREKLERYVSCELYCISSKAFEIGEAFLEDEADKVMDAMERRIARLTALVEGWKRNSVGLSDAYHKRLAMEQDRIKELKKRLEDVQNTMATENVDLGMENFKLKERIKELESQLPKWISVNDRLPNEKEQYKLLWVAHVSMDNLIKYLYEASFDYETKQFYTENGWGDKTFVSPAIWMVVPPPPTTEEK